MEERSLALTAMARNSDLFRLDGKIAVVTGGASGIGRAIAETFAKSGACVHILDINVPEAGAVARQIVEAGGQAAAHECDVSSRDQVKAVFEEIVGESRLHVLVNSAGISHIGTLEDTDERDFERIFCVNVKGVYNCMQASIEHMKASGGRTILNIASIAASAGLADRFAYSMSKGAVIAMTYSVAKDYLSCGIRCNCVSPARVHTPFVYGFLRRNYPGREEEMFAKLALSQPIGRMAEPQEVAALALFLCGDQSSFITGVDYPIDGGFFNLRG